MLCVPILYMLMLVAFFCLLSMNNVNKIKLLFVCMYSLHFQFSALNILNIGTEFLVSNFQHHLENVYIPIKEFYLSVFFLLLLTL